MEDLKSFMLELLNKREKHVERLEKQRSQDMKRLEEGLEKQHRKDLKRQEKCFSKLFEKCSRESDLGNYLFLKIL